MINYRYNETKYAKAIESNGFLTKYHTYELKILAKYYKSLGYKPKKRKELIYEFCKKNIEEFNPVLYFKSINSVLRYASKKENKIIDIENISITNKEIEYIDSLNNLSISEKKILFTLIAMNKINKMVSLIMYGKESKHHKFGGKPTVFRDLFNSAKIEGNMKINELIHALYTKGYVQIESAQKMDLGKITLRFIDNISRGGEVEAIKISTFDNIGYYYEKHVGNEKIIECRECGTLIKISSNRKKYCCDCWKEKERQIWRDSKRKQRNVQV